MQEAALPNYSGVRGGELAVTPWRDLKDRATFSGRNLHIMQKIMHLRGKQPIDPIYVRLLCQRDGAFHNPEEETYQLARDFVENNRIDGKSV